MKQISNISIAIITAVIILMFNMDNGFCGSRDKIMIIANKSSATGALSTRDPAVKASVQRVASYFVDKGLRVYDEAAMADVYSEIELISGIDIDMPDNRLIALALKNNVQVLVKLETIAVPGPADAKDASVTVTAKMFNVSTAKLLAMSNQLGSNRAPNPMAVKAALTAAASKAGYRVGKRLYQKLETLHPAILKTLSGSQDTPGYLFIFKGYTEKENDLILDLLYDELGLAEDDIKEMKVTPNYLETELFFKKKFGRMVRKLKKLLQQEGLEPAEKSRDGGKVVLVKKESSKKSGGLIIE